jgi:hypothetical protein
MSNSEESKDLAIPNKAARPLSIRLGTSTELDLSNLSEDEARALQVEHAKKAIERDDRREKLKEDVTVMKEKLQTFTKTAVDTAADQASITISNVIEDSTGRTEILVGNTEAARAGKLTRSQSGYGDSAKLWLIIAGIAAVVIVLVAALGR